MAAAQLDLALIRARDALVQARTQLVNHVRGAVKAVGGRLPACSTASFPTKVRETIPAELRGALGAVLDMIEALSKELARYERHVETLAATRYPETAALRQVPAVGALTALSYVLTLEDPARFPKSRAVGSYLGLRPKQRDSGAGAPQLRITKAGDAYVRRLLVGSAHYVLGPFGPDSDLRRWGLTLAARGGTNAKKRAVVAVARKLAGAAAPLVGDRRGLRAAPDGGTTARRQGGARGLGLLTSSWRIRRTSRRGDDHAPQPPSPGDCEEPLDPTAPALWRPRSMCRLQHLRWSDPNVHPARTRADMSANGSVASGARSAAGRRHVGLDGVGFLMGEVP